MTIRMIRNGRITGFMLMLLAGLLLPWSSNAYRIGDAIDTEILTPKDAVKDEMTPKRSQMPLFGIDSIATLTSLPDRFSLSFEEGFRTLPWVNRKNVYGAPLDKIQVTFVYSRSGEVHSLTSKTVYAKNRQQLSEDIIVEYIWIEEVAVDLNSGAFVVFLSVFIVSIFFLFDLCGFCDNGGDTDPYSVPASGGYQSSDPLATMSGSGRHVPKYE